MKKYLKIILPIVVISLLTIMGYKVIDKINYKKQVAENIKQMPIFSYFDLEGNLFKNENLPNNKPVLFVYFNSECDFCNREAEMIQQNLEKLKNTQIVFISFEEVDKIKEFGQKHNLLQHDNIDFIADSKATFASTFDIKSLPCLVLYDKERNLIEKIKGQVKIETVLEKFHNH